MNIPLWPFSSEKGKWTPILQNAYRNAERKSRAANAALSGLMPGRKAAY
jgi:hypothetical protein